jgi:hypothetical protein
MKTTMWAGHHIVAGVTMAGADNNQQKAVAGASVTADMAAAGTKVGMAAAAAAAAAAEAEARWWWWRWQE